ncbi:hypothetical protein CEXT_421681 [Caerostris extrusa]|uniref:Uncharacterized protein n=1 Tax=Caerostris extrusa TaxID=172846 RepID=A0AAV4WYB5_CAEEX|nr:hypothetical protein CEXT_421681 [Caerostris extrusa]
MKSREPESVNHIGTNPFVKIRYDSRVNQTEVELQQSTIKVTGYRGATDMQKIAEFSLKQCGGRAELIKNSRSVATTVCTSRDVCLRNEIEGKNKSGKDRERKSRSTSLRRADTGSRPNGSPPHHTQEYRR